MYSYGTRLQCFTLPVISVRRGHTFGRNRSLMTEKNASYHKIKTRREHEFMPIYPCLEERLQELNAEVRDPELYKKVNIGFGRLEKESKKQVMKKRKAFLSKLKQDKKLAELAFHKKLEIDIDAVQQEWLTDEGPGHISRLAEHFGIFKDLFGPFAFFEPLVPLHVTYDFDEETVSPVYRGNIIKPAEALNTPTVRFNSPADALWTLQLTNPDGDLYKHDSECLHWLVTNIRGGDMSTGTTVVPYLPPVPPRGIGYQRLVFVLYRQSEPAPDMASLSPKEPFDLRERSFSTEAWYRQHEDLLTPGGLCWFNSDWDISLDHYYQHTLGMKIPVYEYQFPQPYLREEVVHPVDKNFITYLNIRRDCKERAEELLKKRLKNLHPFKKETPRLPYPCAHPISLDLPSWQSDEIKKERDAYGDYKELYRNDYKVDTLDNEVLLHEAAVVEIEKKHSRRIGPDYKKVHIGKRKTRELAEKAAAENNKKKEGSD
ncbi:Phosphatidylethanolamine-binding protein [Trinorchestia longiramus]|nr:Phosphatidylethanolamine-binding protein [Trinorchestia longiramus]